MPLALFEGIGSMPSVVGFIESRVFRIVGVAPHDFIGKRINFGA
jgi:hypothetical protein